MIQTIQLFPILDTKLIELLRSLSYEEWNKKTIAKLWTVKDIATHLLDTNIRTLSLSRDKHTLRPDREIDSYHNLVGYLNQLNAEWVSATKRLSPRVLIELLEITGKQYCDYLTTLDPDANANISVAWAGEKTSKNWFHVAREYTEKWHHQQQIRDAVGKQGIMIKELFYPAMDTFMHGLPYTYRNTIADDGTIVQITIETEIGGNWFMIFKERKWQLSKEFQANVDASLVMSADIAWKLFTKGISPELAMGKVIITGNKEIAQVALTLVAVMA